MERLIRSGEQRVNGSGQATSNGVLYFTAIIDSNLVLMKPILMHLVVTFPNLICKRSFQTDWPAQILHAIRNGPSLTINASFTQPID